MTDQELKRLEALCEAATPGPWQIQHESEGFTEFTVVARPPTDWAQPIYFEQNNAEQRPANADFIAAARTALPAALAEIRRLRAELKTEQGLLVQIDGAMGVTSLDRTLLLRMFDHGALFRFRVEKIDLNMGEGRATIEGPIEAVPAEKR